MTAEQAIKILQEVPGDTELYNSLWTSGGEVKLRTRIPLSGNHVETGVDGINYLRLSWTDDSMADKLNINEELYGITE